MKPLKHRPKKGLAANIDAQWWLLESQADYAKALLLMRERVSFYEDGRYHREAGAAIIGADGSKYWYLKGKLHRIDGPAIIWASGHEDWYLKGELHRADGPAVIWVDGSKSWYLKGKLVNHETP